jgi:sigma-E factor negative regulatory protein RseA
MVMNENLSRLMDGDLDPTEFDTVCGGLKKPDAVATWTCYHVIGESLRGSSSIPCGYTASFAERLAAEPTVLAPRARPATPPTTWIFAAAATVAAVTVVGWTAMSVIGESPAMVAKAGDAVSVGAARLRPSTVPADYLLAHQEYSPATAMQIGPYMRAVGIQPAEAPADRP